MFEQYDYDAFGYPYFFDATGNKIGAPASHTRFLFTGREWLKELRIYDLRTRQYQPELGRFLQPDPKEFAGGDFNLYRYCQNDPVNRSDPFGLEPYKDVSSFSPNGPCERVSFNLTRPVLGSNIPDRVHVEVTRQIVEADHVRKNGRSAAAVTTSSSTASGASVLWNINVTYNRLDFGPRWKAFSRSVEHDHADAILLKAQNSGNAFINALYGGNISATAEKLRQEVMATEEMLDKVTLRHTLRENGKDVPPDK